MAASGTEPHGEREPRGGEACAVLRGGPVEGSDAATGDVTGGRGGCGVFFFTTKVGSRASDGCLLSV
jgi:hypothetical protein